MNHYPTALLEIPLNSRGEPDIHQERLGVGYRRWSTEGGKKVTLVDSAGRHLHNEDQWFDAYRAFQSDAVSGTIDRDGRLEQWYQVNLYSDNWHFVLSWSQRDGCLVLFHINPPSYQFDPKRTTLYF